MKIVSFGFLKGLSSEQSGCPQERLKCFIMCDNKKYPNLLIAHDFPTLIKHINTIKTNLGISLLNYNIKN